MKNIKEFKEFLNEEFNLFKKNNLTIRINNLPNIDYNKTGDPEEIELEFDRLINLGRGRWNISFIDHSMEYGYGNIIYDQLATEIEDIERYGYESQQLSHNLEPTEDTIEDIKRIIRKNK